MTTKNDDQNCREDKGETEGTAGSDDRVNWSLDVEEECARDKDFASAGDVNGWVGSCPALVDGMKPSGGAGAVLGLVTKADAGLAGAF